MHCTSQRRRVRDLFWHIVDGCNIKPHIFLKGEIRKISQYKNLHQSLKLWSKLYLVTMFVQKETSCKLISNINMSFLTNSKVFPSQQVTRVPKPAWVLDLYGNYDQDHHQHSLTNLYIYSSSGNYDVDHEQPNRILPCSSSGDIGSSGITSFILNSSPLGSSILIILLSLIGSSCRPGDHDLDLDLKCQDWESMSWVIIQYACELREALLHNDWPWRWWSDPQKVVVDPTETLAMNTFCGFNGPT